jgi:hypothetical protein
MRRCYLPIFSLMSCIIKLDHGNNAGILTAHHKISAHPVYFVMPCLKIMSLLYPKQLG